MTRALRLAAVAAGLLASGFTAEHLASRADAPALPLAVPAPTDSVAARPAPVPTVSVSAGGRLPMGPVQGPVSSPFGWRRHPVSGSLRHHDGVDLAVPAGTAVWSVAAGTVRAVGRRRGYGLVVEIDHPSGLGRPVRTRYAHLASVDASLVPGARVGRGVALGASGGRPGRDGVSTGAHLHFEVRDPSGQPLDPASVVRLPDAAGLAPRWASPRPVRTGPRPPAPPAPEPARDRSEADSLAAAAEALPALVLPDYPTLPALRGTR